MKKLILTKPEQDELEFWYSGSEEVLMFLNSDDYPTHLSRDEVVELIGFLSEFMDGDN